MNPALERLNGLPRCGVCNSFLQKEVEFYACPNGHGRLFTDGIEAKELLKLIADAIVPNVEAIEHGEKHKWKIYKLNGTTVVPSAKGNPDAVPGWHPTKGRITFWRRKKSPSVEAK